MPYKPIDDIQPIREMYLHDQNLKEEQNNQNTKTNEKHKKYEPSSDHCITVVCFNWLLHTVFCSIILFDWSYILINFFFVM